MVVSLSYELITFFTSIVLAFLVGILYDFFRAARNCTKITLIWDVLMWISMLILVAAVWFFLLNGEVRWYMILAAGLAECIYLLTLSKYVFFVLRFMMDKICRIFRIFFKILLTPFAFLCKIIYVYGIRARLKFSKKVEEKYDEKKA